MNSKLTIICLISLFFSFFAICAHAAPLLQNPATQPNGANVSYSGNTTNINQSSDKVIINWNSFDVGAGERVNFMQPGSTSVALNRVNNGFPSTILGNINANGHVFIVNNSGILIGNNARIEVGGFLATTANISDADFNAGNFVFSGAGVNSSVVNNGYIQSSNDGFTVLFANKAVNNGIIAAGVGRTYISSGDSFYLDLNPSNALITITSDISNASSVNAGNITAGKTYLLSNADSTDILKGAVNNSGVVSASTIEVSSDGSIILGGAMTATDVNIKGEYIQSSALIDALTVNAQSGTSLDMSNLQTIKTLTAVAPDSIKLSSLGDINMSSLTSNKISLSSDSNIHVDDINAADISIEALGSVYFGVSSNSVINAIAKDVILKLLNDTNIYYTQKEGTLAILSEPRGYTSTFSFKNDIGSLSADFDFINNSPNMSLSATNVFLTKGGASVANITNSLAPKLNLTYLKELFVTSDNGININNLSIPNINLYLEAVNGDIVVNESGDLILSKASADRGNVDLTFGGSILKVDGLFGNIVRIAALSSDSSIDIKGYRGFNDLVINTVGTGNYLNAKNTSGIFINSSSNLTGLKELNLNAGTTISISQNTTAEDKISLTGSYLINNNLYTPDMFYLTSDNVYLNISGGASVTLDSFAATSVNANLISDAGTYNVFIKKDLVLKDINALPNAPKIGANSQGLNIVSDPTSRVFYNVYINDPVVSSYLSLSNVNNVNFSSYSSGILAGYAEINASGWVEGTGVISAGQLIINASQIGKNPSSMLYINAGNALFVSTDVINIAAPSLFHAQKNYKFITTEYALANASFVNPSYYDLVHDSYSYYLYPILESNLASYDSKITDIIGRVDFEIPKREFFKTYSINNKYEINN